MKLCIVTETFPPEVNGVAMTLRHIRDGMRRLGHGATVVRPRQKADPGGPAEGEHVVAGLPVPGYDGLRFGLPCRRRLRRLWRGHPPDIVYVATEGPLGQSAIRAARDLGIPATSGFHTNFHEYMRHYNLPLFARAVGGFLRNTHNRTLATFAPSAEVVHRLREIGVRDARLLGRGVDTERFHPSRRDPELRREWGIDPDNGLAAIFVSRLAAEKNIPLAVRAFGQVRERHPEAACVFVGDGPARAGLVRAHPAFHYAGMRRGDDLARHYASADLFIFPSVTETFGNVVTEAMASGLAVLAYDYAAPRQHIRDGVNGYLAEFAEPDAFLRRLDDALDRRADWPALRRAARETAAGLSWDALVRTFAGELEAIRATAADAPGPAPGAQ